MDYNGEKLYLFNPWKIKDWTDDMICQQVEELIKKYNPNAESMWQLADDIEIIANIQYLYGEMISRLTNDVANLRLVNDTAEAKKIVDSRKAWKKENPEDKMPAMSYFEALAEESVKEKREEQNSKSGMLTRFKYAYDSMEQKANALKKKQDSIRYEEFNK